MSAIPWIKDLDESEQWLARYIYVQLTPTCFPVFIVHKESKEWWRLIATFDNRSRAEKYCDIENDCMDSETEYANKGNDLDFDAVRHQEVTPAPTEMLPAELPSAVTPENFFPTEVRQEIETILIEYGSHTTTTTMEVKRGAITAPLWAPQEADLRRMWGEGIPVPEICETLGRSLHAVYDRAKHLKLGPHPQTGKTEPLPTEVRKVAISANRRALHDPNLTPKRRSELEAINAFMEREGVKRLPPSPALTAKP